MGRLAVSRRGPGLASSPHSCLSDPSAPCAYKQKEARALRSRRRGRRACVWGWPALAVHSWAQMSPLLPPADQRPEQALSERSQLEGGT